MVRIVRNSKGILVDPTSKLSGRGAYLHAQKVCWSIGLGLAQPGKSRQRTSPIERSLNAKLTEEEREYLHKYLECSGDVPKIRRTMNEESAGIGVS